MCILIKSGDPSLIGLWQDEFKKHLPNLDVFWWSDEDINPLAVQYVLVWEPEAGWLSQFPNLRVIFSSGAGVDHIVDRDSTYPKHVPIVRMFTPESAQHMADHVLMTSLMAIRNFAQAAEQQRTKTWFTYETPVTTNQVNVGVMGLGNLGLATATKLHQSGFKVLGWSKSEKKSDFIRCYFGEAGFTDFLANSQLVVNLLPQTPETHHILNQNTLSQLPEGAAVINVGRGTHVDIDGLKFALDSNHLRAAFLDVFEHEPLEQSSWLWTHPKVVITPHVAANAPRAARVRYVTEQIMRYEKGQEMDNVYCPERGY